MVSAFVLTLREGLEAGLIIGILVAYLTKLGQSRLKVYVYAGTVAAIGASLVIAWLFGEAYQTLGETFEGLSSLLAVAVLTYMIFWMSEQGRQMKGELERQVSSAISSGYGLALAGLAFVTVFREGVETVLFLGALTASGPAQVLLGMGLGLGVVIFLSLLLSRGAYRLNLSSFFKYTGYLMLVFAAGMLGQATLALQSAGWLPGTIAAWDTEAILSQTSLVGSILNVLLGYTSQPSVLQVIIYFSYLALLIFLSSPAFKNIAATNKIKNSLEAPSADHDYSDPFLPVLFNGYNSSVYHLIRHRLIPLLPQLIMGLIFIGLLLVALLPINIGPFNNEGPLTLGQFSNDENQNNLFNFTLWVIWLPLVSFSALLIARFWCGNLCPLRLAADFSRNLADRIFGKSRNTSPYLRAGWFSAFSFILITLAVKVLDLQPKANTSAYLFITIFGLAVLVSVLFRRGTWCRYVCPIGGWLARIARLSIFAIRPRQDVCAGCIEKPCINNADPAKRCPTFLNPAAIESSSHCLNCWKCIKNCPMEKSSLRLGMRFPGSELKKPFAPKAGEAIFIAGLMGMYVAAVRQEDLQTIAPFGVAMIGMILAAMAAYLVLCAVVAWVGRMPWKATLTNLGYALLPLEFATAIIAFGDDALGFFGITVPVAVILLGLGYTSSLVLAASILRHHTTSMPRWGKSFSLMAVTMTIILLVWLNWFATGNVIDLT